MHSGLVALHCSPDRFSFDETKEEGHLLASDLILADGQTRGQSKQTFRLGVLLLLSVCLFDILRKAPKDPQ